MNNFKINITGYIGVVKAKFFSLPKNATTKMREFSIQGGPGTVPDSGRRTIRGQWVSDEMSDTVSSYDFEYILTPGAGGNKIFPTPEPVDDTEPVLLADGAAPGLPSKEELKAKKVRRKRGN